MKNNCSRKNRKYGFKAHQKGSDAWFCPFLRNGLESIADSAGKSTCIKNRKPCAENRGKIRLFKNQHHNNGNCSANKELETGKLYAIDLRRKMSDCKNMDCVGHRAEQNDKIAVTHGKAFVHTKKIKTCNRKGTAYPYHFRKFLLQQKTDERNNKNIENGNKTRFSDGCLGNTDLLNSRCKKDYDSADYSAFDKFFLFGFFRFLICSVFLFEIIENNICDYQNDSADYAADSIERYGFNIFHSDALGNKGTAPD